VTLYEIHSHGTFKVSGGFINEQRLSTDANANRYSRIECISMSFLKEKLIPAVIRLHVYVHHKFTTNNETTSCEKEMSILSKQIHQNNMEGNFFTELPLCVNKACRYFQ
jgi:hypothetical protein